MKRFGKGFGEEPFLKRFSPTGAPEASVKWFAACWGDMVQEKKLVIALGAGLGLVALVLATLLLAIRWSTPAAPGDRLPRASADAAIATDASAWCELLELRVPGVKILRGIAAGPDGRIQITADTAWLTLDASGAVVAQTPLAEAANAVAVAGDGTVYLGLVSHVELFGPDRARIAVWGEPETDSLITSVAVGAEDDVFVADAGAHLVWRYDRQGRLRNRIGERDPAQKVPGFVVPSPYFDVAVGNDGTVWAVNPGRHELENFTPEGQLLRSWGKEAVGLDGFVGCCNPSHIARLPDGSFVTSEKGVPRVKQYAADGRFLGVVAGADRFTPGTVGLDLAVDNQGRILVLDPKRGVVRIFAAVTTP